jgi:N-acetylneuraminic acid mutarotase
MRHFARLAAHALLPAVLLLASACGGGGGSGTGGAGGIGAGGPLPTYTVSVTVSGLAGSVVLQDNGGDNLTVSADGVATFAVPVTAKSAYAVSVFHQPATVYCSASHASGTMGSANITDVLVTCLGGAWTWVGGANSAAAAGHYGTLGVSAAGSVPGARQGASAWRNAIGFLYLLGGSGQDSAGVSGELNDLWSYCECDGRREWLWLSGSSGVNAPGAYGTLGVAAAANTPGARHGASNWVDQYGNFWLFGGSGFDSAGTQDLLGDLWKYSPDTRTWQWLGGSNTARAAGIYGTKAEAAAGNAPGARLGAQAWASAGGPTLWLYGGDGLDGAGMRGDLDDLWSYNTSNGLWTWIAGSSTVGTAAGSYGTRGIAAAGNQPGARHGASTWSDPNGTLWLFGGVGYDSAGVRGTLSDLWSYSTVSGEWTWVAGAQVAGTAGVYGVPGTAADTNAPGARQGASAFVRADGKTWLFGGAGVDSAGSQGNLNDLWVWNPATATWTWVAGANVMGASGAYGAFGQVSAANAPGSRNSAVGWVDPAGTLWLLGGQGSAASTTGSLNDLWVYTP